MVMLFLLCCECQAGVSLVRVRVEVRTACIITRLVAILQPRPAAWSLDACTQRFQDVVVVDYHTISR